MIKIYKITSENSNDCYVGSTTQRWVCDRFSTHNTQYRRYCKGLDKLWVSSFEILKHGDCKITVLEETDDKSRECFWIENLKAVNTKKLKFGKKGNPEKKKEYGKTQKVKDYQKQYRETKREELNKKQNEKIKCPHCEKMYGKTNLKRHIQRKHS